MTDADIAEGLSGNLCRCTGYVNIANAVREAAKTEDYLIEPFVSGIEATCGVLEQDDGALLALPPVEISPLR